MVKPGYKSRLKRRRNIIITVLMVVLVGSMFTYLWIRNYTNSLYREIEQLQRKEGLLVASNRTLQIEIEALSRADRIKAIAENEIGMVYPYPETLAVVIEPSTLVRR